MTTDLPWKQRTLTRSPRLDPITPATRRLVLDRAGHACEVCGVAGQALHLHHRQLRRADDHSAANLLALCLPCHRRTHNHVTASSERGWLVSQYGTPSAVPVLLHKRGWCLLRSDGSCSAVTGPVG